MFDPPAGRRAAALAWLAEPPPPRADRVRRAAVLALSVALLVAACRYSAVTWRVWSADPSHYTLEPQTGRDLLLLGWLGIFALVVAWYANPLWALALLLVALGYRRLAQLFAAGAVALGLTTLVLHRQSLPHDEGGVTRMRLEQVGPGFYLWLAALAIPVVLGPWRAPGRSGPRRNSAPP